MPFNKSRTNLSITIDHWDNATHNIRECLFCHSPLQKKDTEALFNYPNVYPVQCLHCYIVAYLPQPTDDVLKQYYRNYYQRKLFKARKVALESRRFAKHILKKITLPSLLSSYKMIDFGGGDGSLALAVARLLQKQYPKLPIEIYVVDFNDYTINHQNIRNITIRHCFELSQLPDSFSADLVLASAVLEHVKNPKQTLIHLFKHLQNNGYFYSRTPYIYPFYKQMKKLGLQIDTQYPAHLFDMGKHFWENIPLLTHFQPYNIKIIHSFTSPPEKLISFKPWKPFFSLLLKSPILFNKNYPYVGGWEVILQKKQPLPDNYETTRIHY